MPPWCPHHRPPCSIDVTRWNCARRTQIEQMVADGVFDRKDAEKFAAGYGLVLTSVSPVYTGQAKTAVQKRLL